MLRRVLALQLRNRQHGQGLAEMAVTMANLARALKDSGDLEEAGSLFGDALAITEKGGDCFPAHYPVYLRGCVYGISMLKNAAASTATVVAANGEGESGDSDNTKAILHDEGRSAVEEVIAQLSAPPYSLPDTHKFVKRLMEYLGS